MIEEIRCPFPHGDNQFELLDYSAQCKAMYTHVSKIKSLFCIDYRNVSNPHNISSSIICLTHANVWESMGKPCSCTQFIKSRIFYYKSRENPYQYCKSRENLYQVLQVTCAASERAMKSKVHTIKSLSP